MPPKAIPAAVRRELDARFQEQNEILERMMQRLEALANPTPATPEPTDTAAAESPTLGASTSGYASSCSYPSKGWRTYL